MNPTASNAFEQLKTGERIDMWEAAKALVKEEDLSVVPRLLELIRSSSDLERRVAAIWTLGFLKAEDAAEPLIRILDDKSESPALRDQAAESLGYLWDAKARKSLVENLSDENPDVVFSCAFALRTVGTPDDIPRLKKLVSSSNRTNSDGQSVAQEAKEAIEQIQTRAMRKKI